jgi:hypothetical protein
MIKFYPFCLILLSSCAARLDYLGNSYSPTKKIDVYVDASAIKRSYTIIGKGYMDYGSHLRQRRDKMQEKAIAKAKANGADAILFEDYLVKSPGTHLETVTAVDTVGTTRRRVESGTIGPVLSTGTNILFLKYE